MAIFDITVRAIAEFSPLLFGIISLAAGFISAKRASKDYEEAKKEGQRLQTILYDLKARKGSLTAEEANKVDELIKLIEESEANASVSRNADAPQPDSTPSKVLDTIAEYLANSLDAKVKGVR